ncbi:MAG: hypothetical protein MAGBODY4_01221 [Candidatus Marinimicrobia bacterium]|nr:hypothetical protein [Candidatus Neomarinimicrobiota bacterium]
MTTRQRSIGIIVISLIVGAMIGTLLGDILGMTLPDGVVKELFLRSVTLSLGPTTVDLLIMNFTLGFSFKLNFSGIIGLGVAYYLLRYFR